MSDNFHTPELLKEYQSYPLDVKVMMTERRIHEFYTAYGCEGMSYGHCYVSFSGGKDSTVLLDIARRLYPNIRACFSNTGLEYPEIREFAQRHENVDTVYPKMTFGQVISKYGYPLIGKEVAEAIYYARRIRSDKRERERAERESHSDEPCVQPPYRADGCDAVRHTHTHTTRRKRTELCGKRSASGGNCADSGDAEPG